MYLHVLFTCQPYAPSQSYGNWQKPGSEFSSVLGLAQLLGKEKDFLSVLAFYTTAIEANKAKVKGCTFYMQEC